jgi:hypothetical protein
LLVISTETEKDVRIFSEDVLSYFLNDLGKFCTYLSTVKWKKSVNLFVLSWAVTSVCHIMSYVISDFSILGNCELVSYIQ